MDRRDGFPANLFSWKEVNRPMADEILNRDEDQEDLEELELVGSAGEESAPDQLEMEEIDRLKKELEEARIKADEYLDGWQRARAEFANYRKRIEREREQVHQEASGTVIRRFLDVLDDLDRALRNRPESGEGADWAGGIELIYRKLLNVLESAGVTPMEAEGGDFDPNLHEAISQEPSNEHESGEIIEVVQNGYLLGDRVLRPARVRVAR
jgi:molecular chaperone GrpE